MKMDYRITNCSEAHFDEIGQYIKAYELDNRALKREEFLIAAQEEQLLGFGRIRQHSDCSELCSLGVLEAVRLCGIGSALVKALAAKAKPPLFLACIIPSFFEPLGFQICDQYPASMSDKLDYCHSTLPVTEPYVVMVKK